MADELLEVPAGDLCPYQRTMGLVRERGSFLILRTALAGDPTTYDAFLRIPELTPAAVDERVSSMVRGGVLAEVITPGGATGYRLTEAGMQLVIILRALGDWAEEFGATASDRPV
ncbi:winged helix-turn-helix transcriptional regulator [Herbiconiux daphne]|uniref:Winged helix-turn-helix transcriptional regulator n=1 Tax=Herbiconiux daphne TaxID=2970914 RepID=A0ABT2H5A8_9MICO|nr:winged helix-turn-helix transcriptional regulator [Herbiconiux daphne]MCS5735129.1 winged helix-turn-helix transcriptional regulator [Herbiconiux daphne]